MLLQFRMFFYRDAQYHRLGSTNLHQIPVNCPFMAKSFSTPNVAGNMRSDANTGGNPHYYPNSFVNKFVPEATEAPYQVADNVVSRQSYSWSEGTMKEYEQARELYKRVMSSVDRQHLHQNTAAVLNLVDQPIIQENYLAQLFCIDPEYAMAIYSLLEEKKFSFDMVKEKAKMGPMVGKAKEFKPTTVHNKLIGKPPA